MKQLLKLCIVLSLIVGLQACEREPDTDIALIEKNLKKAVKNAGVTKCNIIILYGERMGIKHTDVDFEIKNGFVSVKRSVNGGTFEDKYNLLFLSNYIIYYRYNPPVLELYFANTYW